MEVKDLIKVAELQLISTRLERCLHTILLPCGTKDEKIEREKQAYAVLHSLHEWRMNHE